MTLLDLSFALVEFSNVFVALSLNLIVQSTVLISMGLLATYLLRRRGSAIVSTVLRATLVAVIVCPAASLLLDSMGFSGLSISTPKASLYDFQPIGSKTDFDLSGVVNAITEKEGASNLDPRIAKQLEKAEWGEVPAGSFSKDSAPGGRGFGASGGFSRLALLYAELSALWLTIAFLLLVRLAVCHFKLARIVNREECSDTDLVPARDAICLRLGIRPPRIAVSQRAQSPCLFGVLRPTILLPFPAAVSTQVLVHELAHLVRRDPLWKLLGNLLASVLWFQPLVWVLKRKMERTGEEVCDDYVLSFEEDRRGYARYLVEISESLRPTPSEATAGSGVVAFRSVLGRRVERILNANRALSLRAGNATLIIVFLLALVGILAASFLGVTRKDRDQYSAIMDPRPPAYNSIQAREARERVGKRLAEPIDSSVENIRKNLYLLRYYVMVGMTETWVGAIRDLAQIGEPAVPEIVGELLRTEKPYTRSALAFALRAIGDKRAIPGLIDALATCPIGRSDYGMTVHDQDLLEFMMCYEQRPFEDGRSFKFGRPVNEIVTTLEQLTGHSEGDEVRQYFDASGRRLNGSFELTEEVEAATQKKYREVADRWKQWWQENKAKVVSMRELQEIEQFNYWNQMKPHQSDPVAEVGDRAFGPLFPHGPKVSLGPEKELFLRGRWSEGPFDYIDFETGKVFEQPQELEDLFRVDSDKYSREIVEWQKENSLDASVGILGDQEGDLFGQLRGIDTISWKTDANRWDRFNEEIKGAELELGRASGDFSTYNSEIEKQEYPSTFLFRTSEGGAGALQIVGTSQSPLGINVKYRMVEEKDSLDNGEQAHPDVPNGIDDSESDFTGGPEGKSNSNLDYVLDAIKVKGQSIHEFLELLAEIAEIRFTIADGVDKSVRVDIEILEPKTVRTILSELEERYPVKFDTSDPDQIVVRPKPNSTQPASTRSAIEYVEPPQGSTLRFSRSPEGEDIYEYLKAANGEDPINIYTEPNISGATRQPAYLVWADRIVWSNTIQSATATGNLVVVGPDGSRIESATGYYSQQDRVLVCPGEVTAFQAGPEGKRNKVIAASASIVFGATGIKSIKLDKLLHLEGE